MRIFGVLLRKELQESWRTRRAVAVVGTMTVMGMLAPVLAFLTPQIVRASGEAALAAALPTPTASDAMDQFIKMMSQFGGFVAVLATMGIVAGDRERGTAALVLTKPAGRGAYLASKALAQALLLAVAVACAAMSTAFYTAVLFEPLPAAGFAAGSALVWLGLMVPAGITFLGSVIGRSPAAAAGLGIGWLALGAVAAAIPGLGTAMPSAINGPARQLALGLASGTVVLPVLTAIAAIALSLVVSWRAFAGQEL
jgi:ABC-2 type transport system permease protein